MTPKVTARSVFTPKDGQSNAAVVQNTFTITDGNQTVGPFTAEEAEQIGNALLAAAVIQHTVSGSYVR
jgi:hypothetical protein